MTSLEMKDLLEAGAHFGHQTRRWNPKMKPYIYGARNGIHIIDLSKTLGLADEAFRFLKEVVAEGRSVLFVGTKKQAQDIIQEEAERCQQYYVNQRWLGGTLTNFKTMKASIDKLKDLQTKKEDGTFAALSKKENLEIDREIHRLEKSLGGIKEMTRLPGVLFLVDQKKEHIALHEANILAIPVVSMADTNCNPDGIDHLIPSNDDSIRAIRLIVAKAADAVLEGLAEFEERARAQAQPSEEKTATRAVKAGGKGVAYVSRPESFEQEAGVESFSARVETTETGTEETKAEE